MSAERAARKPWYLRPTSTSPSAESSPIASAPVESAEPTPAASDAGPSDAERSQQFDTAIRQALGVTEYSELLADPSLWGGYVSNVEVVGSNAFVTLQVAANDPSREELGTRAAQSLSTLLPAEVVADVSFIVVQDASGVVIAQEQPRPL